MRKIWKAGEEVGLVADADNKRLTLFAGSMAIELNGQDGQIGISGAIAEMHGGSKTMDGLLKPETTFLSLIPSTMFTPIPQSTINIPIQALSNTISDITTMFSLLGG